jgi:GAF domain-containing protein/HAMP domain-containing protein
MFGIKLNIQNSVFLQLLVIAALIIVNYIVVARFDRSLSEVEKTIDLAEVNGTYTQKIMLNATLILEGKEENKSRLSEAVDHYDSNLKVLKGGGKNPLTGDIIAPAPPTLINGYFVPLETLWGRVRESALLIATKKLRIDSIGFNPEVKEAYSFLEINNKRLLDLNDALVASYLQHFDKEQDYRDFVLGIIFIINLIFIFLMVIYLIYNVVRPISKLNEIEAIINEGNYERNIDYRRDDELGKVARSINKLFVNLRSATDFIISIGEGKLDTDYEASIEMEGKKDRLGAALMEMRDKMSQVAESDSQRNWVSEGLAKFAEIFRTYNQSEDFNYIIISNLVKYVEANQGGLFIVENADIEDSYLELVAAYAYEKRKYMTRKVTKGEGLIGEVYREGGVIYMTEIPESYVHITSGLGGATPRSLLLVPLKLNDEIYGVVELASFEEFEPYKIEFVQRLGESIASTFASVKSSTQTQKLLKESLQLSEQMKAQEEEMRQNLEELMATQEEVQRKNVLIEEQKKELERSLEEEQAKMQEMMIEKIQFMQKYETLQDELQELKLQNQNLREQLAKVEKAVS